MAFSRSLVIKIGIPVLVLVTVAGVVGLAGRRHAGAARLDPAPVLRPSLADAADAADRMAFVPPGALSAPEAPWGEIELRPGETPDGDGDVAWSTEARPAPPGATVLPTLRRRHLQARPGTFPGSYSLGSRMAEIAPAARARLAAKFEAAKAAWPPAEIAFVAIKDEKALELFSRPAGGTWQFIHRYRVLAASGSAGPKLRQGDRQVPEGVYGIAFLNPNSAYHVSMRVNYPNAFDRQMASLDGRRDLGGDIMIHGKNLSAGCLAMGDEGAEELFVLAAQTGASHVRVIIAPTDFRRHAIPAPVAGQPDWLPKLYAETAAAMAEFKAPQPTGLLSFFMK